MFSPDQYQLIDFGEGRRLERFGPLLLDRPCPVAEGLAKSDATAWREADARFERTDDKLGQWICRRELSDRWNIAHGPISFELKRTEFGHLGLFAEQAANWDWIVQRVRETGQRPNVLNLFAYTGGSTLAAAAAGAEVVHVDSARNTVAWARRNAELSSMADLPIRWIAEDATKFAKRELKRGNLYDAVILDPPSYGHGPRGEVWRLSNHMDRLLQLCQQLTAGRCRFLLLTCHTPGFDQEKLGNMVAELLPGGRTTAEQMKIESATGRRLPCGVAVRWQV